MRAGTEFDMYKYVWAKFVEFWRNTWHITIWWFGFVDSSCYQFHHNNTPITFVFADLMHSALLESRWFLREWGEWFIGLCSMFCILFFLSNFFDDVNWVLVNRSWVEQILELLKQKLHLLVTILHSYADHVQETNQIKNNHAEMKADVQRNTNTLIFLMKTRHMEVS